MDVHKEYDISEILPHLHHRGGVQERLEPDTLARILNLAKAPGAAPALRIVMRPSVWDQIYRESNHTVTVPDVEQWEAVVIEITDDVPMFPGFEIYRWYPQTDGSVR